MYSFQYWFEEWEKQPLYGGERKEILEKMSQCAQTKEEWQIIRRKSLPYSDLEKLADEKIKEFQEEKNEH